MIQSRGKNTLTVCIAVLTFAACLLLVIRSGSALASSGAEARTIQIGLNAAMSGAMGQSGEAIRRGVEIAIDEINETGGVLGREFELVVMDHRGIPARGVDNINDLAAKEDVVAVVGGLHTPVALAEVEEVHRHRMIYLGPWAAGTSVVDNGHEPNYVFRVSARDQFAGGFLIDKAMERGFRKPGLLLWRTGWGRSNLKAMSAAMARHGIKPAGVEWFNTGQRSVADALDRLIDAGADVIMLVANASEGLTVVRDVAARLSYDRLPIISHWGITGAEIVKKDRAAFDAVDLTFLQTYSFHEPTSQSKADQFRKTYCAKYGACGSVAEITSPVGTAHAYDLVHLLKRAIEKAGTTDREMVRSALERLERYDGLVRTYDPPFTPDRHDALDALDLRLCRYSADGAIMPVTAVPAQ